MHSSVRTESDGLRMQSRAGLWGRLRLLETHREGQRPVLTRLAVDGQPPFVAAWLERQRRRVDRDREVERGPGLETGRSSDLELASERHSVIVILVCLEPHRTSVGVEQLHRERVHRVRQVPWDLDQKPYPEGSELGTRLRPPAADDRELAVRDDRVVREEHRRLHGCRQSHSRYYHRPGCHPESASVRLGYRHGNRPKKQLPCCSNADTRHARSTSRAGSGWTIRSRSSSASSPAYMTSRSPCMRRSSDSWAISKPAGASSRPP